MTDKCKIVLLGYPNTGKSSLIYYLVNDTFLEDSLPTIGISFNIKITTKEDWTFAESIFTFLNND